MKIIQLTAENVKKIRAVSITPKRAVTEITGDNGEGKSSVLDCIFMALGGKDAVPGKPIRSGEQHAKIKLDLGEIVVTRRFSDAGTTLVVEAANGARFTSPQRMLDELMGSLSFDPLAFTRMDAKTQMEEVRKLVTLEVDVDALRGKNASDFETRTDINREVKRLESQLAGLAFPSDTPDEAVDTQALALKLEQAGIHNTELERRKQRRANAADDAKRLDDSLPGYEKRILELQEEIEQQRSFMAAAQGKAKDIRDKLASAEVLPDPIDPTEIRTALSAAEITNKHVATKQQAADATAKAAARRAEAQALSDAIDARNAAIAKAIGEAKMPVDGLSFGDGAILFKGIPFDQASSAEQLRVSVAIAMAANPKLRVMLIKDGGLLSEKGMAVLTEMIAAADYQVFIEKVDTTGKIGVYMEDGSVAAVDGVKVEALKSEPKK